MMTTHGKLISTALAILLVTTLTAARAEAQGEPERLFQRGLMLAEVEGDFRAAIAVFQQLVDRFPDDRALAARALAQMGRSYEKLNSPKARDTYDRVVREYPDQSEAADFARHRLGTLLASAAAAEDAPGVVFRQIEFDGLRNPYARLSPDGGKMVYWHVQEQQRSFGRFSIRVRDLASGDEKVLVENGGQTLHFEWSPDGSKIVYRSRRELRTLDVATGDTNVLWSSPDDHTVVIPLDWSADGRLILAAIRDLADWTERLAIFPSSGGPPRHLVSGKFLELEVHGQFSPDGTHIAGVQTKDGNTDIYVWAADGSEELRVTHHRGRDDSPFWSPDGRHLVFRSDRAGDDDLWALPTAGSIPTGAPLRIKTGLGARTRITDLTRAGQLTMWMPGEGTPHDLFVLPVNSLSGESTGEFQAFARFPTQHAGTGIRWSPDGSRLVYKSRKEGFGWPRIFVGLGGGREDIELPMRSHYVFSTDWARNGEGVIFAGYRRDGRAGIFSLSLNDYSVEELHLGERIGPQGTGALVNLQWLPAAGKFFVEELAGSAGKHIYLMGDGSNGLEPVMEQLPAQYWTWPSPDARYVAYRRTTSLHLVSLEDQDSRTLMEWPDQPWFEVRPGWSPDGRRMAWADRRQLNTLVVEGGISESLVVVPDGSEIVAPPAWSPDGSTIAYVVRDTTTGEIYHPDELWAISSGGGSPWKIADAPSTHPHLKLEMWRSDGTIVARGAPPPGTHGSGYQHWVLEGFLPEEAQAARR